MKCQNIYRSTQNIFTLREHCYKMRVFLSKRYSEILESLVYIYLFEVKDETTADLTNWGRLKIIPKRVEVCKERGNIINKHSIFIVKLLPLPQQFAFIPIQCTYISKFVEPKETKNCLL